MDDKPTATETQHHPLALSPEVLRLVLVALLGLIALILLAEYVGDRELVRDILSFFKYVLLGGGCSWLSLTKPR